MRWRVREFASLEKVAYQGVYERVCVSLVLALALALALVVPAHSSNHRVKQLIFPVSGCIRGYVKG